MILAAAVAAILIDQSGYAAAAPKIALIRVRDRLQSVGRPAKAARFFVRQRAVEIASGELSPPMHDANSGDDIQFADFSSITTPGDYEFVVGDSRAPLHIESNPYARLQRLTMLGFYGQRCGTAVTIDGGRYAHPACHLTGAFHPSSGRRGPAPSIHGWHDAGDYGRYVVNSGIATGTLLWAAEMFGSSEILDEARWNLDWMLSMQDTDGGVWHKQTSEDFAPFVQPQDDKSISYVIGKGSCATADFTAVMAIASRVYRAPDAAFADRARSAAERAWAWVTAHPNVTFKNPRGVKTGEYGDRDCSDERAWAAAELWRSTADAGARAYFLAHLGDATRAVRKDDPPSWQQVGAMAAWTYWMGKGSSAEIERLSIEAADAIVARARTNAYRIPMTARDYVWGSNGVAANYGMQLLVANAMHPRREYVETAAEIVHYLLGRNTFALSFLTGAGTHSVMHPHHRPSASDGVAAPWPGLLAGGPNRGRNDGVLRALPANTPPARVYVDEQASYAGNEIAINWNAPLAFVLTGLQKLQGESRPEAGTVSMNGTDLRRMSDTSASTAPGGTTSSRRK